MLGVEALGGRFLAVEAVVGKARRDDGADRLLGRDVGIGDGRTVGLRPRRNRARVVRADDRGSLGCGGERRVEPCRIRHAATLRGRLRSVKSGLTALPPLPRMTRDDRCPGRKPGLIGKPVRESLAIPALPPQR